jgi:hypothetical protein
MIIETKRFTNVIEMPSCKTWAKGDHGSKKRGRKGNHFKRS